MDRRQMELSDDQMERIAQRSAEIAWENFQKEVGKVTLRSALYLAGLGLLVLLTWLGIAGKIKL